MTNSNSIFRERSSVPVSARPSNVARVLVGAIAFYRRLSSGRLAPCRFYPSCSHYAQEAIELNGAWRGTGLALRRLSRCRPLGPHGIDLVPVTKKVRSS
jgi:putative membrane protein insertion efficiency factor